MKKKKKKKKKKETNFQKIWVAERGGKSKKGRKKRYRKE